MRHVGIAGVLLLVVCLVFLGTNVTFAQATKVVIKIEPMNPGRLEHMGLTDPGDYSYTAGGVTSVAKGYTVWLSGWDVSGDTAFKVGSAYSWNLTPAAGSSATLDSSGTQWNSFMPDTTGNFAVQVTIDGKDTTVTIKVTDYDGVDRSSVSGAGLNCRSCHEGATPTIYSNWAASGHALMFEGGMNGTVSSHWGESCLHCHTTGYNLNALADNGGFDDVAAANGFALSDSGTGGHWMPFRATNYDSLKGLSNGEQLVTLLGGIACENCHGPYAGGGSAGHQPKSMDAGVCAQCHNEPWRHNIYSMYENSLHAEAVYSTSFRNRVNNTTNYGIGSACVRCHDGGAFVAFTKGDPFDDRSASGYGYVTQNKITCQTCHEPHSAALRTTPTGSDTLGNGFSYGSSGLGEGMICANCHKYRRDSDSYVFTGLSSHWGPHHGGAADVFLGQNAQKFGQSVPNINVHKFVANTCIGCHMSATPDTGTVARDKIGGHSWTMEYEVGGQTYDNVTGCVTCHTGITSFDDIMASEDYDGDGTIEPAMEEVAGLLEKVAMELPPIGTPTIDYSQLDDNPADSAFNRMAYWNYLYISEGSGHGAHNPIFAVGLLTTTYNILTGISTVELVDNEVPIEFELAQNYPNPFNPSTEIMFSLPKAAPVLLEVYDVTGRVVATLVNEDLPAGNHRVVWNATGRDGYALSSGMYLYRIAAGDYVATKKMVLLK